MPCEVKLCAGKSPAAALLLCYPYPRCTANIQLGPSFTSSLYQLLLLPCLLLPCCDPHSPAPSSNARQNASLVCKQWRRLLSSLPLMARCAGKLSGAPNQESQRPVFPARVKAFVKWGRQHNLVAARLEPCTFSFAFVRALKPLCREGGLRVLELDQVEASTASFRALSVLTSLRSLSLGGGCIGGMQISELSEGIRTLQGLQRLELDVCYRPKQLNFRWLSELTGLTNLLLGPCLFESCVTALPLLECLTLQQSETEGNYCWEHEHICFEGCVFGTHLTSLCLRQVTVNSEQSVSLGFLKRLEVLLCTFKVPREHGRSRGAWYDCFCVENLEELLYQPFHTRDDRICEERLSKCLACQLASQSSLKVLQLGRLSICELCPCRGTIPSVAELKLSLYQVEYSSDDEEWEENMRCDIPPVDEWEFLLEDFPKLKVLSLAIGTAEVLEMLPNVKSLEELTARAGVSLRLFSGRPSQRERYSLALSQYDVQSKAAQLPLPVGVVEGTSAGVKEWVSKAVVTDF